MDGSPVEGRFLMKKSTCLIAKKNGSRPWMQTIEQAFHDKTAFSHRVNSARVKGGRGGGTRSPQKQSLKG
jgi:hypothetical protein